MDEQLSQDIVLSIDDTHSFIRPNIESMIFPQMMNCIDYLQTISDIAKINDFIVAHDKLFEYGITKSNQSNHIKERLDASSMSKNEDYLLHRFREQKKPGS